MKYHFTNEDFCKSSFTAQVHVGRQVVKLGFKAWSCSKFSACLEDTENDQPGNLPTRTVARQRQDNLWEMWIGGTSGKHKRDTSERSREEDVACAKPSIDLAFAHWIMKGRDWKCPRLCPPTMSSSRHAESGGLKNRTIKKKEISAVGQIVCVS
jgi:hypothetical protein